MELYKYPWKLIPNKIYRYPGGRELDRFRGISPGVDDNRPEAWVGSDTRTATAGTASDPYDGCSECILPDDTRSYLFEAVKKRPDKVLGERHMHLHGDKIGVLVKLLDAQHQLGLQTHPSRPYAREHFKSMYGKEESWYIIGLREDSAEPPYVLLGFKEGITRDIFEKKYDMGDITAMEQCCHKIPVQVGDAFYIKAGVPHAIGCGCFMVEVQEPSDITVGARKLPHADEETQRQHMERLLGCYVYEGFPMDETLARYRIPPRIIRKGAWGQESLIIGSEQASYFSFSRLDAIDRVNLSDTGFIRIMIVLDGAGSLTCGGHSQPVKKGDEFFLPYQTAPLALCPDNGRLSVILCNPTDLKYTI